MKEAILQQLFSIIYSLRRIEMNLLIEQKIEFANKIRETNRAISAVRNRLIAEQLTIASEKLNIATGQLKITSDELQAYLDEEEAANIKLKAILNNLPVIINLANSLIR